MTLLEIILTIALAAIVILALHKRDKVRELTQQLRNGDRILQDITTENVRLKRIKRIYDWACLQEHGEWIIIDTCASFLVCKTSPKHGEIALIARSYKYNSDDPDDRKYKLNCAEELLEKLTESV